jgi:ribosomal protein L14E/L6E/L27E
LCSLKPGKVVIILQGRYAGRKAVVMKNVEDNNEKKHPFGHCIVAGIERYPLKVKRSMSDKTIKKRTTIKPFVKVVNHNHIMPTRCVQARRRYSLATGRRELRQCIVGAALPAAQLRDVAARPALDRSLK